MSDEPCSNVAMQLLIQARAGDQKALGALLNMYRQYLSLIARLQIDQRLKTKFAPSDLVQETFLCAKRGLGEFRGNTEAELMAWLRRIMANRLLDLNRRYSRQSRDVRREQQLARNMEHSSAMIHNLLPSSPESSPSESMIRREQAVLLANALAALPEHYRDVLVLRHLEGRQIAEVAEQLGRSVPSVKNIWVRAIAMLRETVLKETSGHG